MNLLPPRVIGPLSVCSNRVRVEGQVSGADVEVYADGRRVAADTATSSAQTFTLTDSLSVGEEVVAQQTIGSDTSDLSPEPVFVQAEPEDIGPVGFRTKVFECGECLWLEGLVPGAEVEARADGMSLGSRSSYDGNARVGLSRPMRPADDLVAQQRACGRDGAETDFPELQRPVGERQGFVLPPPTVEEDLRACERRVTVSGVYPGATVTLHRSDGPDLTSCFDLSSLYFTVNPPLSEGETISASQKFHECELFSEGSRPVTVDPAEPVKRPGVRSPLCAEGTTVTVTNLRYGATVYITVVTPSGAGPPTSTTYYGEAPDDGAFDFLVPPLPADAEVYAEQELCSIRSEPSQTVAVDEAPEPLDAPAVQEPLFECATTVRVADLTPGTRVLVYSAALNAPIGERQVYAEEADVRVAPGLVAGDEVYAAIHGCGHESEPSAPVEVQPLQELEPPVVDGPLYACNARIRVENVVPGARVDVYVNGEWRGGRSTGDTETTAPISVGRLDEDDKVQVRQSLCGRSSELSRPVTVQEFVGRWCIVADEDDVDVLAVHAALLHTGKILYFGGDEHHEDQHDEGDVDNTELFDCDSYEIDDVTGLPENADLFCAGQSLLEDGILLTGGGTAQWALKAGVHREHFPGSRASWLFDLDDEKWEDAGTLNTERDNPSDDSGGRWYPTLVTLPDGRALALGGHPAEDDTRHQNNDLELYSPSEDWSYVGSTGFRKIPGWRDEPDNRGQSGRSNHFEYPRLHVVTGGDVLSVSSMGDGDIYAWNPYSDPTAWSLVAEAPAEDTYQGNPQNYSSVLLPLKWDTDYRPEVLVTGGEKAFRLDLWEPTAEDEPLSWSETPRNMPDPEGSGTNPRRRYSNAVLLPSGEVIVVGGVKQVRPEIGIRQPELYDPETNTWTVLGDPSDPDHPAIAEVVRNYHSVTLLMPDGAVWTAGSNLHGRSGGPSRREYRIEVFEPWYFCYDRPTIVDAPGRACHGDEFGISVGSDDDIDQVVLVRCGSTTHAFDPDQRYVSIPFTQQDDVVTTQIPNLPSVAVPGYYLLFVLDEDNVPSEGEFLQVCQDSDGERESLPSEWPVIQRLLRRHGLEQEFVDRIEHEIRRDFLEASEDRFVDENEAAIREPGPCLDV